MPGNIYTRIMNPTQDVLEKRVAEMEGGIAALALASGQAAVTYSILTISEAGDNIVSASTLYGGTYNLFAHTLPQYGIEVRFADYREPDAFEKLIDAKTKAVFCESIGNPLGNVTDFARLARHCASPRRAVDRRQHRAHAVPVPSVRTWRGHRRALADQVYGRPWQLASAASIVDSGKFPWAEHKQNVQRLNEPDVSYHGVVYTEALGPAAYIGRARVVPLRNMGAAISPFNSFLDLAGHRDAAAAHGPHLREHAEGRAVPPEASEGHMGELRRPAEPQGPWPRAEVHGRKASGIFTFGVKGGRERGGRRFQDALKLVTRLVNIGDCKSLACHPASTTHRQLSPAELAKAGVTEDTVRLSIGIEHIDDIIADLEQALGAV